MAFVEHVPNALSEHDAIAYALKVTDHTFELFEVGDKTILEIGTLGKNVFDGHLSPLFHAGMKSCILTICNPV